MASGHRMQPQPDKYLISQTVAVAAVAVVELGDSVGFSVSYDWGPLPTSYSYQVYFIHI